MYSLFTNMSEIGFGTSLCADSQGKIVGKTDKTVAAIIDYGTSPSTIHIVSDALNESTLPAFCGNIIGTANVMLSSKVYNGNNNDSLIGTVRTCGPEKMNLTVRKHNLDTILTAMLYLNPTGGINSVSTQARIDAYKGDASWDDILRDKTVDSVIRELSAPQDALIKRNTKATQLFSEIRAFINTSFDIPETRMSARSSEFIADTSSPFERMQVWIPKRQDNGMADEVNISFSLSQWLVRDMGKFDDEASIQDTLIPFLKPALPMTAILKEDYASTDGSYRGKYIRVRFSARKMDDNTARIIEAFAAWTGVPAKEDVALFNLQDQQTGKNYQVGVRQDNAAGIQVIVPGFNRADNMDSPEGVLWLEAFNGDLVWRAYLNPKNEEPSQIISLEPLNNSKLYSEDM
ncbi:MAG: hypothetical protein GY774_23725 [Planctomycetes bacterium]|nr:hypothetical protein [Planctomycetota bacterium]